MLGENTASSSNTVGGFNGTTNDYENHKQVSDKECKNSEKLNASEKPTQKCGEKSFLIVDVKEARLFKNYGFLPMNLYCRLNIGGRIYETPTSSTSGKHAIWNKRFHCCLPDKNNLTVSVQIICENMIFADSEVANAEIELDQSIYDGFPVDQCYELGTKTNEGGTISVCFQHRILTLNPQYLQPTLLSSHIPTVAPMKPISGEDIRLIREIFPSVEEDTIASLFQANGGDREKTVGDLIRMSNEQ